MKGPDADRPLIGHDFDDFFRLEYRKLLALGLALAPDAAPDLAQEALVRACRRWDTVSELDVPGAWVRRVMLRLIADHRRTGRRRDRAVARLAARTVPHQSDLVSEVDVDREWMSSIRQLPRRQAECVALHYVGQLYEHEVAAVLGVSAGTVKTSLSRARESLRADLGRAPADEETVDQIVEENDDA